MYDGRGYYLVAADGGVFAFGDAGFYGSMGGRHLNAPIVGIASTGGAGYYLGGRDGGVFTFGDANFWGSAVGLINSPEIAIGATDENIGGLPVPPLWIATIFAASGETVQPQS